MPTETFAEGFITGVLFATAFNAEHDSTDTQYDEWEQFFDSQTAGSVAGVKEDTAPQTAEEAVERPTKEEWEQFFDGQTAGAVGGVEEDTAPQTAEEAVKWMRDQYSVGASHVSYNGPDERNPYVLQKIDELPDGWERNDGDTQLERNYLVKQ